MFTFCIIVCRALSADEIARLYKMTKPKFNVSPRTKLTDGLVGYWTFDGPDMAGTTATDVSTNTNNGTLTNGPKRAIGRIGQALEFDGDDDHVLSDTSPVSDRPFTICAWFNSQDATSAQLIAMVGSDTTSGGTAKQVSAIALRGDLAGDPVTAWNRGSSDSSTKIAQSVSGYKLR